MANTNPDAVKLLSDDALREIEIRPRILDSPMVRLTTDERDALCQTVRALRAEHEWLREAVNSITTENTALRDQLAELRTALQPFAALDVEAFSHLRDQSNDREIYKMNDTVITVGDVRRARALLQQEQP